MTRQNKVFVTYGLFFADLLSIVVSFIVSTYVRFGNFRDMEDKSIHFQVCPVFLLFCAIYSFFLDWNRNFLRRNIWKECSAVVQYNLIMFFVVEVVMYFLKWADVFSRLVMGYFVIMNTLLTIALHCGFKKLLRRNLSSEKGVTKIMIISERERIAQTAQHLREELGISYQIVAIGCIG